MEFTRHNFKNKEPEESNSKRNDNSRKRKHPLRKVKGKEEERGLMKVFSSLEVLTILVLSLVATHI